MKDILDEIGLNLQPADLDRAQEVMLDQLRKAVLEWRDGKGQPGRVYNLTADLRTLTFIKAAPVMKAVAGKK